MAPHGPPFDFDFDLNEPPPPENDSVDGMSAEAVPEPSVQQDPVSPAPVPEPTTAHVPLPARSLALAPEASPDDPLPARSLAPAPEASPVDHLPAPQLRAPVPVPSPHHHLPSPVLDLEAPLSSLDDEDEDEADLPLPPPPPLPLPPPPPPSWYRVDTSDAPTVSSGRQGDAARQYSSPETWAPRGSRAATASDTTSSHRSRRRRPYSCDDAISNQPRVVDYDEDGGSSRSRSGSRRRSEFGSPRRYEHSGPAPPRHYNERDGRRHAPAPDGQPVAPVRNRRRRRGAQKPHHGGLVQKQQGFRRQERPQVHHWPHHGPEVPKVGYASYSPPSGSFGRRGAPLNPEQERVTGWDRRPCREKDAPPFRPSSSSRPHGREDPKTGGYQHRDREAPSFRPSTGSHGGGGRHIPPPEEKTIAGGAHHHQQTKAPRGRDEQFPDQAYHPYARRSSGFDRPYDGGRNPARREPRDSYDHRRYSKELRSGGPPARGLRLYGDVQE